MPSLALTEDKRMENKKDAFSQQVREKDGKRLLKINLMFFTLTLTLNDKKMTVQEYEDQRRIKQITEEFVNKRLENSWFS